jgi:muramoyltetrapeptide carboxypeptidase
MKTRPKNWSPLEVGDFIDVISPASSASFEEIKGAKKFLKEEGFHFRFSKSARHHPYLAGADSQRGKDFIRAVTNSKSRALWCLRGGYGSARILNALARLPRPQKMKILIGLSDITALHFFLNQEWGWPTLHAPVLTRLGMNRGSAKETKEILDILRGRQTEIRHRLSPMNSRAKKFQKTLRAPVRGGNLTVLQSLVGTRCHPDLQGRILFLEDVGERGYRLDRTLHHLLAAGVFRGIKGVVLGDFIGGDEPNGKNFVKQSLDEFASQMDFPVWSGIKSGHGTIQRPVALETPSQVQKSDGTFFLIQATGALPSGG